MDNFPGWTVEFDLLFRQETSRSAAGRTRVKDFGTPLWRAIFQSKALSPNQLDEWRARLNAQANGLETFRAWPRSRCWPILHPNGEGVVPGEIAVIGADRKTLEVDWDGGEVSLSVGDFLEIDGRWLVQVSAVGGGAVTVVPHLPLAAEVGQSVNVDRPGVLMAMVPGSAGTSSGLSGRGSVSFQAMEARG